MLQTILDRAAAGGRITPEEALRLYTDAPLHALGLAADAVRRCGEAVELGATQIMLQGGHSPEFGIEWYEQTFAAIKRDYPQLTLHSLGASVQDRTGGFRSFIAWTYQPGSHHLQGSWLATGTDVGQLTLHFGADDLGSVLLEENVVSSAGARHRSNRTELIELIRGAGRIPAQRDTLYRHLVVHRDPAEDAVDARVHSHVSSTALRLLPAATT